MWIMTPKRKFPVKTTAEWATHRSNPIKTAMKNTLLYSSLFALAMSGNLRANEPATLSAGQQSSTANTSAFSETFDTGYGYRHGSYGYPYGRGRGYGRGGGYGYRGRGCY